jgi:hypothetical protein
MGISQLYSTEEFFKYCDPGEFKPGQFCRVVTPHSDPVPRILDIERSTPQEHEEVRFELRNACRAGDFKRRDRVLPIKYLNLKSHEELLAQRAKKRFGIILATEVDIFPEVTRLLKQKGKKHYQDNVLFVTPCYNIETAERFSGFPPQMVERIKYLIYKQFYYFPNKLPQFTEGVARFDRIQIVSGRDPSAIEPIDVSLSHELLGLFLAMFVYCITGVEYENLKAARDLLKAEYHE